MGPTSRLTAYSFNHRNTALADRDVLSFTADERATFVARVRRDLDCEAAIVATCNRTEFYLFGPPRSTSWATIEPLVGAAIAAQMDQLPEPDDFADNAAARHLCRVATSLESMALGENQILGQLKDAHEQLLQRAGKAPALDRLFQYAVRCGKEIRTQTALCEGHVSVSSVAVQLAAKIFGDFAGRRVLIVGAGETAEKAATNFQAAGAVDFVVVNRSAEKGQAFARQFDGVYRPLADLNAACQHADIVLVATGAKDYLVTKTMLKKLMKQRHHRSIFLIDISNPRNIDPDAGDLAGVYLYNMDDLQTVVSSNLDARRQEIPAVEAIVDHFVDQWDHWYQSLQVTPTIATLAQYFDAVRQQEIDRHGNALDADEQTMLDEFSEGLVKKLLHHPIMYLRSSVQQDTLNADDLRVVRSLFKLRDFDPEGSDED